MNVPDGFDIVRWVRTGGESGSLVARYHQARNLPVVPVTSGVRLGHYLMFNDDPEVVAFGHEGIFDFMASRFILSVDPSIEPWTSLRIVDREMRQVARSEVLGWNRIAWWVDGKRRREVDVGLTGDDPVMLGEIPAFEQKFWQWVGDAEIVPGLDGSLPTRDEVWLEVVDVLVAFALAELLQLDPERMPEWDWRVDTYRVPPL